MTSEVAQTFPLCPGHFSGKGLMISTLRGRICNPLRNLSANPPRALKWLRFSRVARKPENTLSDRFSEIHVPPPFCSTGNFKSPADETGKALSRGVHTEQTVAEA